MKSRIINYISPAQNSYGQFDTLISLLDTDSLSNLSAKNEQQSSKSWINTVKEQVINQIPDMVMFEPCEEPSESSLKWLIDRIGDSQVVFFYATTNKELSNYIGSVIPVLAHRASHIVICNESNTIINESFDGIFGLDVKIHHSLEDAVKDLVDICLNLDNNKCMKYLKHVKQLRNKKDDQV